MQTLNALIRNPSGFDSLDNYVGPTDFPQLEVLLTQNRDSDSLTRSNFTSALIVLGGESDNVVVYRFGHWACGWYETLSVRIGTPEHAIATDIEAGLADYPVVDDEHYSELQWNEAASYWEHMSLNERVKVCQRFDITVFAARRDEIPQDDNGSLFQYLTTD